MRLHAARNMPPVLSTHVGSVCAASAHVNVSVLYQFVDTATWPWPTDLSAPWRRSLGRAVRGSVAPRKVACRAAAGTFHSRFKAIDSR